MMKFVNIFFLLTLSTCSISCKGQKTNSKVTFNIENGSDLKYSLYMKFTTHTDAKEMTIELSDIKNNKNKVAADLKCKTPYQIRLQSGDFLSQSLKYYNKTCNDTTLTITFKPLEVIKQ